MLAYIALGGGVSPTASMLVIFRICYGYHIAFLHRYFGAYTQIVYDPGTCGQAG